MNKPKRPHEQSLPFVWRRYADDMDRWLTEEVLPVLTWAYDKARTNGPPYIAVGAKSLIQQITEGGGE